MSRCRTPLYRREIGPCRSTDSAVGHGVIRVWRARMHSVAEGFRLLPWYAGHGQSIKGEGFLVPVDAPAPRVEAATVLVIEDEDIVQQLVQAILENAGHRVLLASDGQQGLELYRRHQAEVDLVIFPGRVARRGVGRLSKRRTAQSTFPTAVT